MTGIEKITEMIAQESGAKCEAILAEGAAEVKKILTDGRKKASKLSGEIVAKAQSQADLINAVAKSKAEAITRNRYLEIRNAILNDIISAAYEEIEKLGDEEYFDLIKKLCIKNIQPGECTMFMNGYDLGRLPDDFELQINSAVFEKSAVYIANQPLDIENGFILSYGNIQINCTLKSVFDENMDKLKDMLSVSLFD